LQIQNKERKNSEKSKKITDPFAGFLPKKMWVYEIYGEISARARMHPPSLLCFPKNPEPTQRVTHNSLSLSQFFYCHMVSRERGIGDRNRERGREREREDAHHQILLQYNRIDGKRERERERERERDTWVEKTVSGLTKTVAVFFSR
jgi:hypothetical protein